MRVLVAYATRSGSTKGIAEAIGDALRDRGADVDVREAAQIDSVAGYDAVILGSAVRMRRWLRDAMGFLLHNREQLRDMPVAYFAVSLSQVHHSSAAKAEARRYVEYPMRHFEDVRPVAATAFKGLLDYSKLSPSEAMYVRAFGVKEGDYRDWDEVRDWSLETAEALGVLEPALA